MTLQAHLERIEGHPFAAVVNLASDLRTFLRIVEDQPDVQALDAAMSQSPEVAKQLLQRALELVSSPADEGYEHPADAALAAYLHLLQREAPLLAGTAARAVLAGGAFWWARKVAELVSASGRNTPDGLPGEGSPSPLAGHAVQEPER
jgi:hypothetical protein